MKRHLLASIFMVAAFSFLFASAQIAFTSHDSIVDVISLDSIPTDHNKNKIQLLYDGTEDNIKPELKIWPEAPHAWQFKQVTMPVPSLLTGAATFDVPIYEIELDGFKLPLSLKYHSNGIRIDDDYQPIGFGWILTPPLRIMRRIYGRPDGDFKNVSDTALTDRQFFSEYSNVFKCAVHKTRATSGDIDRFDTEHDVFTVYLADKSFNMIFDKGKFVTVGLDEYKIETDNRISYINITDPMGNLYTFSRFGAMTDGYQLEWLPSSITTLGGKKITFEWRRGLRGSQYGYIPPTIYNYKASETKVPDFMYAYAFYVPTQLSYISNIYDIAKIDFVDGYVEMNYDNTHNMLNSLVVTNKNGNKIKSAYFTHSSDYCFLTSVKIDGIGDYTFDYIKCNNVYKSGQDWWGFPNGVKTNNDLLAPALKMTSYKQASIYGADRKVDSLFTSHGMLRKAVYPTGAISEWEYEIHKFPKQVPLKNTSDPAFEDIELSAGGGVRVKRLKMYNGADDQSPIVRRYIYGPEGNGLANCVAIPSLSSFVSFSQRKGVWASDNWENIDYTAFEDNYLTIDRVSNYAEYRSGETLIWYSEVKEIENEGYTIYNFQNFCRNNVFYTDPIGHYPHSLYTIFSSGPQETKRRIYNSSGQLVQTEEKTYKLIELKKNWLNQIISRKYIQTVDGFLSPDFDEDHRIIYSFDATGTPGQYGLIILECPTYNYTVKPYTIYAYTEQLVSKKTTLHSAHGSIEKTAKFEYVDNTSLPSKTTISSGTESIVLSYSYNCGQPLVDAKMKAANVVGYITGVSKTYAGKTSSYNYEMGCFGTSFRPVKIWKRRGDFPQWSEASYLWNNDGTLKSHTGSDGIVTTWTWDTSGRYPLSKTIDGKLTFSATWKPLVGVSSLTAPNGIRNEFQYNSDGRLIKVSENGNPIESYDYRINQDGNNYQNTRVYRSELSSFLSTERYDAMGRLCGKFVPLESEAIAYIREYDSMGRLSKIWSPTPASFQESLESIKVAAKQYYNDQQPYTEEYYEDSPRSLTTSTAKAGFARHGYGKGVKTNIYPYTEQNYNCKRYQVSDGGVSYSNEWEPGSLTVTVRTDEDGIVTESYTDLSNHVVCESRSGKKTYYVYDDYGDLRYILPPGLSGKTLSRTDEQMKALAFWYDYDSRGQCILAKEPGRCAARMCYDPAGRLAAEQSANHEAGVWRLYAYDNCGRQVLALDCQMTDSEATEFSSVVRKTSFSQNGSFVGYNITPETFLTCPSVVWAKYYDNYDFVSASGSSSDLTFLQPISLTSGQTIPLSDSNSIHKSSSTTGKLTGIYTGAGYEAYYYDVRGLELQRAATGFNSGRRTTLYTYDHKPSKQFYIYNGISNSLTDRVVQYEYDSAGRLVQCITTNHRPNPLPISFIGTNSNTANATLDSNSQIDSAVVITRYDDAGRPAFITMGKAQKVHSYDCNGWLTSSVVNYASQQLNEHIYYNESGRISSRSWNNHSYSYSYNSQGFLTGASYGGSGNDDYDSEYTYDDRGNILSLRRNGITDITPDGDYAFGIGDEIDATYDGNQLVGLRIRSDAESFSRRTGFGVNIDAALTYDSSGRLYSDESRGIISIEYNNDGHPIRTVFSSGECQTDEWDGFGNHLSTTYLSNYNILGRRRYTGDGHIIRSGSADTLEMARFDGGFFDHAGNIRFNLSNYRGDVTTILDNTGSVLQSTDYYPYGEPWAEPSQSYSPFMFGGKERLRANGIKEYDQGARRYVSAFPFFTTPDTKASLTPWLSPYSFCASNPVNVVDPSGNLIIFINGMHFGDGGSPDYWEGVDNMVMEVCNDNNALYIDGSMGGVFNIAMTLKSTRNIYAALLLSNINPLMREIGGFYEGMQKALLSKLKLDNEEKIRIITHSMGAAFAKGFISGAETILGNEFLDNIEYEIDLAPFIPMLQHGFDKKRTYTINHKDDYLTWNWEMPDSNPIYPNEDNTNGSGGHGIKSFEKELKNFLEKMKDEKKNP